jgi:hypothetical protein
MRGTNKENEMGRACSMHGEMINVCRILVRKPEVKSPLSRCRQRWQYNIKMDFREIGLESVDWIRLAKVRDWCWVFMNMIMNFWFHKRQGIS